jgi:soluble lytic murein transglycosylase-like protein
MRSLRGKLIAAGAALLAACTVAAAQPSKYSNESADDVDPALRQALIQAIADSDSFDDRFDAEVWLTDMSQRLSSRVTNVDERLAILKAVHQQATAAGLPPELVLAVIDVESNFDRFAISRANALGLMQIMPFWIEQVGESDMNRLFDINFNILLGCRILKYYIDMEKGELVQALARYNGSTGRRDYGDTVLDRLRLIWFRH